MSATEEAVPAEVVVLVHEKDNAGEFAGKLQQFISVLKGLGLKVFHDFEEQGEIGENQKRDVLLSARCLAVVWGKNSIRDAEIEHYALTALDRGRYISMTIEDVPDLKGVLHFKLARDSAYDLSEWFAENLANPGFKGVLQRIGRNLDRQWLPDWYIVRNKTIEERVSFATRYGYDCPHTERIVAEYEQQQRLKFSSEISPYQSLFDERVRDIDAFYRSLLNKAASKYEEWAAELRGLRTTKLPSSVTQVLGSVEEAPEFALTSALSERDDALRQKQQSETAAQSLQTSLASAKVRETSLSDRFNRKSRALTLTRWIGGSALVICAIVAALGVLYGIGEVKDAKQRGIDKGVGDTELAISKRQTEEDARGAKVLLSGIEGCWKRGGETNEPCAAYALQPDANQSSLDVRCNWQNKRDTTSVRLIRGNSEQLVFSGDLTIATSTPTSLPANQIWLLQNGYGAVYQKQTDPKACDTPSGQVSNNKKRVRKK